MPSVQHPTARWPCTLYMLILSYSVHPTVWGHDHGAHWPNCMTTHHCLWVFCVCKVTLHYSPDDDTPSLLCPVSILAIWGHQVIHCEGQLQAWVRSECWCRIVWPLLGPAAAAVGVLVAALSHSSATTELRCTHTLQQGETSTATATLHIGSYVAKYFKQILQPVSQQNEILTLPLIMTAF